jgi:hypothetical protein
LKRENSSVAVVTVKTCDDAAFSMEFALSRLTADECHAAFFGIGALTARDAAAP